MDLSTTIKQHPVASFIVFTLVLSFAAFLLPVTGEGGLLMLLCLLAAFPTLVAFALVALMEGRRGVVAFLRQSFHWRSPLKWYLIAFAIGFVIHLGSSVLALLAGRISAIEISAPDPTLIFFVLLALLEEIGWRGFALRRLLDHLSPFTATLIVGFPWALIHFTLTLMFLPTRSPLVGGLMVLAYTLPLTWIFVKSGHNVLVATVLHFAMNAFGSVVGPFRATPEAEAFWFLLVSAYLIAAVVVLIDWHMWFAHPTETMDGEAVPSAA